MKQENIDFLTANRNCYREVTNVVGGRSAQLAHRITGELLTILREEFIPGYPAPHDCGNCLFNLVTVLYEKFDEYMAKNPQPVVVAASFPVNEPPTIDPEYQEYLNWKKFKEQKNTVIHIHGETVETPEERKARLKDPNRVIVPRKKRK